MRKSLLSALEIDQSLRHSRSIFVTASIIFLPTALIGLAYFIGGVIELFSPPGGPREFGVFSFILGVVCLGAEYSAVSSAIEAQRRLKRLREDPTRNIHPMPAGFLTSFFSIGNTW